MRVTRSIRYPFHFKGEGPDGVKKFTIWIRARYATIPVTIILTADHVRKSMALKGVGNTQTCSMSLCMLGHKDCFSHKVAGYADWTYRRAAIATVESKKSGFPMACVIYAHNSKIAHLNDTEGGQQKLLEIIERDGPITVNLLPIKGRRGAPRRASAKKRSKQPTKKRPSPRAGVHPGSGGHRHLGTGARRRAAAAALGGI